MKYLHLLIFSYFAITCCDHNPKTDPEIVSQVHHGMIIVSVGNLGEEVEFGGVTMPDLMNEITAVCRDLNIKTDEHNSSFGVASIDVFAENKTSLIEAKRRFESGRYRDRIKLEIDK